MFPGLTRIADFGGRDMRLDILFQVFSASLSVREANPELHTHPHLKQSYLPPVSITSTGVIFIK